MMEPLPLRATVAYDGTDFAGFQLQAQEQGRTVQGVLEAALEQLTGTPVRVIGAGRTDAGVHALGQVVGFRAVWRHPLSDLQRALNAVLPADVAVLAVSLAEPDWHPRFSAVRRHYRYTVLNRAVRSPLDRRYAHLVTQPLDLERLQAAADQVVGEHDFASFGRPMEQGSQTTVRVILSARWHEERLGEWAGAGSRLVLDLVGNAFLRGMVRSLVGTMLQIGAGLWPVEQMTTILAARQRGLTPPPAPACGLCLMQVDY